MCVFVLLVLELVNRDKNFCFIRITGESITISNCEKPESLSELIKNCRDFWNQLGKDSGF